MQFFTEAAAKSAQVESGAQKSDSLRRSPGGRTSAERQPRRAGRSSSERGARQGGQGGQGGEAWATDDRFQRSPASNHADDQHHGDTRHAGNNRSANHTDVGLHMQRDMPQQRDGSGNASLSVPNSHIEVRT